MVLRWPGSGAMIVVTCLLAALAAAGAAWAEVPYPITLRVGTANANPGDSAEIAVRLAAGGEGPSVLVVYLAYDPVALAPIPDAYEFVLRDPSGQPLTDGEGNTLTRTGPVRLEAAAEAVNRSLDTEIHPEGVIAVALFGSPAEIPDGLLFTVAFRVAPSVAETSVLPVRAVHADNPIAIFDEGLGEWVDAYSSAALQDSTSAPLSLEDGRVVVGCVPADTPTTVQATQGLPNAVTVTWRAVATPNAEYRVYRSADSNPANAAPLGDAWQLGTSFSDITASLPVVVVPGGCFQPETLEVVRYFYWVKARAATGCESAFSSPGAEGYRGGAEKAAQTTALRVSPAKSADAPYREATSLSQLALQLEAEEAIDAGSVWGIVSDGESSEDGVQWMPGGAGSTRDGWAVYTPGSAWALGAVLTMTAGAETVSGVPVGPVVESFLIVAGEEKSGAGVVVRELADDGVPWLAEGVGVTCRVEPAGIYAAPQWIWLPVPADAPRDALQLHYFDGAEGEARWFTADEVTGWVAGEARLVTEDGQAYLGYPLRHGGVVQLGFPMPDAPSSVTVAPAAASPLGHGRAIDAILLALVAAFFVAAARLRRGRSSSAS